MRMRFIQELVLDLKNPVLMNNNLFPLTPPPSPRQDHWYYFFSSARYWEDSGLVRGSTSRSRKYTCETLMIPLLAILWIKCWSSAMCFILEHQIGLKFSCIVLILSQNNSSLDWDTWLSLLRRVWTQGGLKVAVIMQPLKKEIK